VFRLLHVVFPILPAVKCLGYYM